MPKLDEMLPAVTKATGVTGSYGGSFDVAVRIPSGIFPLDLAIGGGIPRGRMTEIYGPEGSGKTNLALKVVAMNQKLRPADRTIWFDMEGTWDPEWSTLMGVDVSKVLVLRPDYAEEVSDLMYALVEASDVGMIVLDSLAAMVAQKEVEADADKALMGNTAIVVKRLVNRLVVRLKHLREDGDPPAIIWINQTRTKLGVMFGDPETTPGGNSPRFAYSLRLRLYGKNITDKSVSEIMPVAKKISCVVKKWKVAITAAACEFDLITQPHNGFAIGDVDDWNLVEQLCKNAGILAKKGTKWVLAGQEYKVLKDAMAHYYADPAFANELRAALIKQAVKESGYILPEKPLEAGKDYDAETGEVLE